MNGIEASLRSCSWASASNRTPRVQCLTGTFIAGCVAVIWKASKLASVMARTNFLEVEPPLHSESRRIPRIRRELRPLHFFPCGQTIFHTPSLPYSLPPTTLPPFPQLNLHTLSYQL